MKDHLENNEVKQMTYNGANRKTTSMIQSRNQNKILYWLITTFEVGFTGILELLQTGTSHFVISTSFDFLIRNIRCC